MLCSKDMSEQWNKSLIGFLCLKLVEQVWNQMTNTIYLISSFPCITITGDSFETMSLGKDTTLTFRWLLCKAEKVIQQKVRTSKQFKSILVPISLLESKFRLYQVKYLTQKRERFRLKERIMYNTNFMVRENVLSREWKDIWKWHLPDFFRVLMPSALNLEPRGIESKSAFTEARSVMQPNSIHFADILQFH